MSNNNELRAKLLIEASDLLEGVYKDDILNESINNDEGKIIKKEIEDAIKEKDDKKLKIAIQKFKKWFLIPDPEGKHEKLRLALLIIYALLSTTVTVAAIYTPMLFIDNKKKFIISVLVSFISMCAMIKTSRNLSNMCDTYQKEYMDEFINKYEKKVKELEKSLDKYDGDKTSKEYKQLANTYKQAIEWLNWAKQRKDYIAKKEKIDTAKLELKEAKKSKDKQEIAEKKAKYNAVKNLLVEASDLLGINETDVYSINEAAKFNFFPKFKKLKEKYPELAEADSILNEGNDIISEMGEIPTKSQIKAVLKVLLKILKYLHSVSTVVFMPFLLLIAPIIPYTIGRLMVYLEEFGYNALEASEVKDQLIAIKKIIDKTDNKSQKERLEKHYEKLNDIYKKLN